MSDHSLLHHAVQALAGVCDGAFRQDGVGFNSTDTSFGHSLAGQPAATWSFKQAAAAYKMIARYQGQLRHYGIDYQSIPVPVESVSVPSVPVVKPVASHKITNGKDSFVLSFNFANGFDQSLIDAVKAIPGRRYDAAVRTWSVPAKVEQAKALLTLTAKYPFTMEDTVREWLGGLVKDQAEMAVASKAQEAELEVGGLGGTLRPFQKAGVAYALKAMGKGGVLIGDEPGLGKTIEALAVLQAASAFPALIVCPASLKINWKRETEKWLPGRSVIVLNGGKDHNYQAEVVILNYDVLRKHTEALAKVGFKAIIMDESHYLKSYRALRTIAVKELAKAIPIRLALTGTPVLNRPQELLSQLGILGRLDDLGGFWHFAKRYCEAYQDRFGWNMKGAANLEELNQKMRASCLVRRTKDEVLKELPAKQRANIMVELDNRREYERAERDLIGWLKEQVKADKAFNASLAGLTNEEKEARREERAQEKAYRARQAKQLVRIEALKQLCARGKMEAVKEWVASFLESGEKLVLFAHHTEIVETLAAEFNAPTIMGSTPLTDRQAVVDRFQGDPDCKLIVCNIQAGGVGLTLTAASNVAFVELAWNPAAHDQATDRTHRIGQTKPVTAWYLLADETIDQEIYELIEKKRAVVDAATDGTKNGGDVSVMKELVEGLLAK